MSENKNKTFDQENHLDEFNWDIEPERDLWPDIQSNIRFLGKPEAVTNPNNEGKNLSKIQQFWMPTSVAACMILALGAFIMSSMSFKQAQNTYQLQASYIEYQKSQIGLIEQQHKQVRAQSTALLAGQFGPIDSTTSAEVQAVLLTIDNASLELKEAILAQPTNANYASMLARTYQKELKLLNKFKSANSRSI